MTDTPTETEVQDVRDLIIATCEHDPEFRSRGAEALRIVNRLAASVDRNPEGRNAEERFGAKHESAVPKADAQPSSEQSS